MNYDELDHFYIGRPVAIQRNSKLTAKARQSIYIARAKPSSFKARQA